MEYPLLRKRDDKSDQVNYCAVCELCSLASSKRARDIQGDNVEQAEETTAICLKCAIPLSYRVQRGMYSVVVATFVS